MFEYDALMLCRIPSAADDAPSHGVHIDRADWVLGSGKQDATPFEYDEWQYEPPDGLPIRHVPQPGSRYANTLKYMC